MSDIENPEIPPEDEVIEQVTIANNGSQNYYIISGGQLVKILPPGSSYGYFINEQQDLTVSLSPPIGG